MVQTANPGLQSGEQVDIFLGVNLIGQKGWIYDHRLAFEVGFPLYRDFTGPQFGTDLQLMLGWQKAF